MSDQAGRSIEVKTFQGGTAPAPFGTATTSTGTTTFSYATGTGVAGLQGQTVNSTDPAGIPHTHIQDGAGRLIEVDETCTACTASSGGTANFLYGTSYAYDALDNLMNVFQGTTRTNGAYTTPFLQPRIFSYDFRRLLTTATNPESGVTQYVYDANGNLLEKRDQRGGAPALAVCYGTVSGTGASATCDDQGYDVLNRPLRKSYLDGSAAGTFATVTYTYDSHLLPCPSGVSYPVLRLTAVSNAVSTSTNDCFDPLGRITQSTQTTAGGPNSPYLFTYQYNLAGEQTQIKYPSGRIVTTGYDNAARALTLMSASGTNYVTSVTYAPHGAATQMALKNGALIEQNCFNSRLQPEIIRQRTGAPADCGANPDANDLLHLKYVYGVSTDRNNGDIASQTITRGAHSFQQAYTYDTVGRLASAAETAAWSQTYGYDAFGNQWVADGSGFAQGSAPTLFTAGGAGSYDQSNHLTIQSAAYDGVGNQKAIGGYQYVYDGENRMVQSLLNAPVAYLYDGSGNRVAKVDCATGTPQCTPATGATTTWYIYDAAGQLASEYDGSPAAAPCATCYLMDDHLGSTRMMSDGAAITDLHDYLPFGEEIAAGIGSRDGTWGGAEPKLKFTGKLRDDVAESGLDYFGARYFSGPQGRWTSPDPKRFPHDIADPQSWNKYGYTRNSPLRYVDPDGEDWQDYLKGVANAWFSDNSAGALRTSGGSSDFKFGQSVGDAIAEITGAIEVIGGGSEAVTTAPAAASGVGALIPAAGVVLAAHGRATMVAASIQLAKDVGEATNSGEPQRKQGGAVTEPSLPDKTVVKQDGVSVEHYTRSGDHGPPHLHVSGEGPSTRIGQAGKPLSGDPELSSRQAQVVKENKGSIRKAVDQIGRWFRFNEQ